MGDSTNEKFLKKLRESELALEVLSAYRRLGSFESVVREGLEAPIAEGGESRLSNCLRSVSKRDAIIRLARSYDTDVVDMETNAVQTISNELMRLSTETPSK